MMEFVGKQALMMMSRFAFEFLMDSDDDTMECVMESKKNIVKIVRYVETTVMAMDDSSFRTHFRLTRGTCELLSQVCYQLCLREDLSAPD